MFLKNGISKKNVEAMEEDLGFGLYVTVEANSTADKKPIVVHTTAKDIAMDIRIKSKKEIDFKCGSTNQSIRGLNPKQFRSRKFAIQHNGEFYSKEYEDSEPPENYYVLDVERPVTNNLKAEYEMRKKDLNELCDLFHVEASAYMYNEKILTRAILYENIKYLQDCDHVTIEENKYLNGAFVGALNYAQYDKPFCDGYGYDINSFYPYVMSNTDFKFPLTEGTLKRTNKKYALEIKKLKINGTHKYWRNSPENYYDSYQVELLDLLKIPYEEVDEPKLCFREPVNSSSLFSYFNDIYDLKKNGNKHAKLILNSCHGQLSRKKEYEIDADNLKDHEVDTGPPLI